VWVFLQTLEYLQGLDLHESKSVILNETNIRCRNMIIHLFVSKSEREHVWYNDTGML